jgi:hypothetical protein
MVGSWFEAFQGKNYEILSEKYLKLKRLEVWLSGRAPKYESVRP